MTIRGQLYFTIYNQLPWLYHKNNFPDFGVLKLPQYIQNKIRLIYSRQEEERTLFASNRTLPRILGSMMILSGIYLTYAVHESPNWHAWWYIGTIYLAFLGVGIVSIENIGKTRKQVPHNRVQEDNTQE